MVFRLFRAYEVPGHVGVSSEGYSYFRYYPIVALLKISLAQFLVLALGASCHFLAILARRGQSIGARAPRDEWPNLV